MSVSLKLSFKPLKGTLQSVFMDFFKMTPKEKFLNLVSHQETDTLAKAKARQLNRNYTHLSQCIALTILDKLENLNWSQKDLAKAMGVSPQLVNKWVRGNENFTLETLANLKTVLGIELIAVKTKEML